VSAMLVLIGFSLAVATGFLIAFLWAVKSGQYDDKYTPSVRILFDDSNTPLSADSHQKSISVKNNSSMQATSDTKVKLNSDDNNPQSSKNSNKQIKHTNN